MFVEAYNGRKVQRSIAKFTGRLVGPRYGRKQVQLETCRGCQFAYNSQIFEAKADRSPRSEIPGNDPRKPFQEAMGSTASHGERVEKLRKGCERALSLLFRRAALADPHRQSLSRRCLSPLFPSPPNICAAAVLAPP